MFEIFKRQGYQKTVTQWYSYYRDTMTTYLVRNPVVFNANSIVHVDETAISGRCKYGRGREIPMRWLFGIVDRANHKCFAQFIDDKSHPSIIPIITNHVNRGGATIHSDGAKVYRCLSNMDYTHNFVVHEHHYIDPLTVHSNHIENL